MKSYSGLLATAFAFGVTEAARSVSQSPLLTLLGLTITAGVGLATIASKIRQAQAARASAKLSNLQSHIAEQAICAECRAGTPPMLCPYGRKVDKCALLWRDRFDRKNKL